MKTRFNSRLNNYFAFSITWTLNLNIAFLYLSKGKVIYTSGRFLTRDFEVLFRKKGAQQKRCEIFNQPLIRFFRRRQYVDILTSKKQSKEPENRDTLQKIFSD